MIIVAELVTNACKHAYPRGSSGSASVVLERTIGAGFRLTVEDRGLSMARPTSNSDGGIGHRLVATIANRLNVI